MSEQQQSSEQTKPAKSEIRLIISDIGSAVIWIWSNLSRLVGSLVLIFLVFLVALIGSLADQYQEIDQLNSRVIERGGEGDEEIAVVKLYGEIVQYAQDGVLSFDPFIITPGRTERVLKALGENSDVGAVVLLVNSPGGSVVASEEIFQQIKQLQAIKPVVVSFGDVAASGGYYISIPATKIVSNQATLTGSIGVIAFSPNASGLYEKLGLAVNTYKSGEYKDMGSYHRSETDTEQEIFQGIIDDSFQLFLQRIREEREISENELQLVKDGRVLTGAQAKELGLVDEVGTSDTAIDVAIAESGLTNPAVVEYQYGGGVLSGFISSKLNAFFGLTNSERFLPEKMGIYYLWQQ